MSRYLSAFIALIFLVLLIVELFIKPQDEMQNGEHKAANTRQSSEKSLTMQQSLKASLTESSKQSDKKIDNLPKNAREDKGAEQARSTSGSSMPNSIPFSEVNPYSQDTEGIDPKFIEGGIAFESPLTELLNMEVGQPVTLDLGPIHYVLNGELTRYLKNDNKLNSIQISFPDDGSESFIDLHFSPDGTMEGKLYTSMGNYELVHNGKIGFIISFEEMERLERLESSQR